MLEFEDLRFKLAHTSDRSERRRLLDRMVAILRGELVRTTRSYEIARRDSRLGWEWEQDYIYTPEHLRQKLALLRATLNEQIPAWKRRHGL